MRLDGIKVETRDQAKTYANKKEQESSARESEAQIAK